MTTSKITPDGFYEEQFLTDKLARYGNRGRVLFGLVRLEEHAANMAAAWLQGGWNDAEVSEILTTGLLKTVVECADYVELHRVVIRENEFNTTWTRFLKKLKRLQFENTPTTESAKSILILLPLAVSVFRNFLSSELNLPESGSSLVSPQVINLIRNKAEELGVSVLIDSEPLEALASVQSALRNY